MVPGPERGWPDCHVPRSLVTEGSSLATPPSVPQTALTTTGEAALLLLPYAPYLLGSLGKVPASLLR